MTFTQKLSIIFVLAFVALAFAISSSLAAEETYGDLRGRFLYDGEPPAPKPIEIVGFEHDKLDGIKLFDESLVVDPKSHGLANVVVFLYLPKDEAPPAMHPSYRIAPDAPDAERTKVLRRQDTRFMPHVVLLRTDEILQTSSEMKRSYDTKFNLLNTPPFGEVVAPQHEVTRQFSRREKGPAILSDSIYPWMRGWLVIQNHPYMAVTDAEGRFEIRDIPAGKRTFRFWHERSGFVAAVTVDGREIAWEKGLATFDILSGETVDLGEVRVSPSQFDDTP